MRSVFASDLHLHSDDPAKVALFESFLTSAARANYDVYLLGDVFEIWLGDDDDTDPNLTILRAMHRYSESGGRLYVMSGNRDFLFGSDFAAASGAELLPEFYTLELGGVRTLLTHGDLLCTKDVQYQAFRKYVRDPQNQKNFLAHSLSDRRKIAAETRSDTQASMLEKDEYIMDVEQSTVEQVMNDYGVTRLIHGHTHRAKTHEFELDGVACERIVLGDWYGEGSVIVSNSDGVNRLSASEFTQLSSAASQGALNVS